MDNLTHSLAGALLGQLGLKRLTGLAMPTLIIAANLPDIDAVAAFATEGLALRRGLTHGPVAMVLLPLALTAAMLGWARWRPRPDRAPVVPSMILLVAVIGTLSHPALDWLNSYGVRLLEPFSSRWFAGDSLFIIDVWLWIALIAGVWLSRRRERAGADGRRPAIAAFAAICAYIFANGLITGKAEALGHDAVARMVRIEPGESMNRVIYRPNVIPSPPAGMRMVRPTLVIANPQPLRFWRRKVLWRGDGLGGSLDYDWLREANGIILEGNGTALGLDSPALRNAASRGDVRAFIFWSRMPIVVEGEAGRSLLTDQRFASGLARGRFAIPLDE